MNTDISTILKEHYQLSLESHESIRHSNRSFVIKCETIQGSFILKRVKTSIERLEFLIETMEYLRYLGIHIPITVQTNHRRYYVSLEGNFYYLQEWIPSVSPSIISIEDLIELSNQIGKIHRLSFDYHPPQAQLFFKENNWEQNMKRTLFLLRSMRLMKFNRNDHDFFLRSGELILNELENSSSFQLLKSLPLDEQFLCHNDLHSGNILKNGSKLFIIDWDLAKYDLPAKDLNGLVKLAGNIKGEWDKDLFESMLHAYTQENPLSIKILPLIISYLAFPHNALSIYIKGVNKALTPQRINSLLQIEKEKTEYLLKQLKLK